MGFVKFCGSVWNHWEARFGTTFAVILAVAQYLCLAIGDPDKTPKWVKEFPPYLWLAVGAVLLFWACYGAWDEQHEGRLNAEEELADRYPRLKGEISLGYLDIGKHYEKDRLFVYDGSCIATFYLHVINHSKQDGFIILPPVLKLTINGREYPGDYVNPMPNVLRVNDSELKGDGSIYDLFGFGTLLGSGVFQKPRLHPGWLMFNIPDSQVHLGGSDLVVGAVSITLRDTLGGFHRISIPEINFRLNKIGVTRQ